MRHWQKMVKNKQWQQRWVRGTKNLNTQNKNTKSGKKRLKPVPALGEQRKDRQGTARAITRKEREAI